MKTRIILASASPRRRELLHQVGLAPEIVPSHVEEVVTGSLPAEVVMELSAQKAENVASGLSNPARAEDVAAGFSDFTGAANVAAGCPATARGEEIVVIGADTVVAADGRILGKPKSVEDARQMIGMLQGRKHQVYTGVTMIFLGRKERVCFAEETDVLVYPMDREQIDRYVATGEPMDKAGAYGIQGRFAAHIQGIAGDYNNVVGLPVGRVCQELMKRGLWQE